MPALLRWTDRLSSLIESVDQSRDARPLISPVEASSAELQMLEQERDLLAEENRRLKSQVQMVSWLKDIIFQKQRVLTFRVSALPQLANSEDSARRQLESANGEVANLRRAYEDIVGEVTTAYDVRSCQSDELWNPGADAKSLIRHRRNSTTDSTWLSRRYRLKLQPVTRDSHC